jgi:glycosyltransferase involved in cell wall biosynthesis
MNVIFFTYEEEGLAGHRRCEVIASNLKKRGHETSILNSKNFSFRLFEVLKLGDVNKIISQIRIFNILKLEKNTIFYIQRVNYHSIAPFFCSVLNGNKLVVDIDDWSLDGNFFRGLSIFKHIKIQEFTRNILIHSSACIVISMELVEYYSNICKKIYYLPVITDDLHKKNVKMKSGDDGVFIFSWMGTVYRNDDVENIKFIIAAFSKFLSEENVDNVFLEIIGGGTLFFEIKKFHNYKNIKIKDWIAPDKIYDYLSSIDVGLVPLLQNSNYNKYKTPTKLFDYLSAGKPVIVSEFGETNTFVKSNYCGAVAANNVDAWIKLMRSMYSDKQKLKWYAINNAKLINEKYSTKIAIDLIEMVLSEEVI